MTFWGFLVAMQKNVLLLFSFVNISFNSTITYLHVCTIISVLNYLIDKIVDHFRCWFVRLECRCKLINFLCINRYSFRFLSYLSISASPWYWLFCNDERIKNVHFWNQCSSRKSTKNVGHWWFCTVYNYANETRIEIYWRITWKKTAVSTQFLKTFLKIPVGTVNDNSICSISKSLY